MNEICQKCKEVGEDRRTLWMACFYEMNELQIPFVREKIVVIDNTNPPEAKALSCHDRYFYTLRVCKDCRSNWMRSIQQWFNEEKKPESIPVGSGIYIREFGKNVEISEEEFKKRHPGIEPVRIIE